MTDKEPLNREIEGLAWSESPLKPDLQSAKDFLLHITRRWPEVCEAAQLEVTGISRDRKVRAALFSATPEGIEAALEGAENLNRIGFNIYFGVNPIAPHVKLRNGKRPEDRDIAGAVFAFADGDDDGASKALLEDPTTSIIVTTGSIPGPRIHAYWELNEPMQFGESASAANLSNLENDWRTLQKGLISYFHSDVQVKNPSRLMRLPGFISHAKDATRVNDLVTWRETGVGPVDRFLLPTAPEPSTSEMALNKVRQPVSSFGDLLLEPSPKTRTDEELRSMLEATRIQGQWHHNMLRVTASLVSRGWTDVAISEMCGPYCNDGPTDGDLMVMIEGARRKGWAPDKQEPTDGGCTQTPDRVFRLVRASDLEYREPEFIIKGLIETESLAQIFGDSGGGKSFIALDIAACISSGTPFHGHEVKQGAVIYIAGEGHNGLKRRLIAWEKQRGVSLDLMPLFLSEVAAQFLDAASAQAVAAAVDQRVMTEGPPALIIVDTLARNFGPGDENATKDMSNFVAVMDRLKGRYKCTLILVHHTGHSDKDRGRGSAALKAALDAEFRVEKTDDIIRLVNTKMKDAAPPSEMYFRLETVTLAPGIDGAEVTSAALVKEERDRPSKKRLTDNEALGLRAFRHAAPLFGKLNAKGDFEGLHREDWRVAFYEMSTADSTDSKRKAFNRARADLQKKGEISVKSDIYLLTGDLAAFDHIEFEKKLKIAAEAKEKELSDTEEEARDTGQGGTNAGQVPVPSREEPGQAGQGSTDPSLVPPGVDDMYDMIFGGALKVAGSSPAPS